MNDPMNEFLGLVCDEFSRLRSGFYPLQETAHPSHFGCMINGRLFDRDAPPLTEGTPVYHTMKPDGAKKSNRVLAENVMTYESKTIPFFSTPRQGSPSACKILTKRAQLDLASQLRYAKDYVDKYPHPKDRGMVTKATTVEYMQGFERDWTSPFATLNPPARARSGRLRAIDLFSGIGGLTLACDSFLETILYCEQDERAQAVLQARMNDSSIDTAPIHANIATLNATDIEADVVIGGFPCQDVSTMGKRKGFEGEKTSLFFQAMRVINECKAKLVIFENVRGIINCSKGTVFKDMMSALHAANYDAKFCIIEAAHAGAPHRRPRFFLIALRRDLIPEKPSKKPSSVPAELTHDSFWSTPFPDLEDRMLPRTTHENKTRLGQLGNAVCPPQGRLAMRCLIPGF